MATRMSTAVASSLFALLLLTAAAHATTASSITLANTAPVSVEVISKDAIHILSLALQSPKAVSICSNCSAGNTAELGTFDGDTELVFSLTDATCGQSFTSMSSHGRIDQTDDNTWTIHWDDAGAPCGSPDGDLNDLIVKVTAANCDSKVEEVWPQFGGTWGEHTYDDYNGVGSTCRIGDGTTDCHIRRLGCALTTLAMALKAAGVTQLPTGPLDPGTLNDFMRCHSGDQQSSQFGLGLNLCLQSYFTANHDVEWDAATHAVSPTLKFRKDFTNSTSTDDLDKALCGTRYGKPLPVVVGVKLNGATPGHFVLVTKKEGKDDYRVADPATGTFGKLPTDFVIRGVVADPTDTSALDLYLGAQSDLLVIDPDGLRTGFDPDTKVVVQNIPDSAHFIDSLADDESGEEAPGSSHMVEIPQPVNGAFNVIVSGLSSGLDVLHLHAFATDGSSAGDGAVPIITAPGSVATFTIQYSAVPGVGIQLSRAATYTTTLGDITNARRAGLIDSGGIMQSLAAKIREASRAASSDRKTAMNLLQAFKSEVSAQAGKHVDVNAAQVLIDDANSLIGILGG